MIKDIIGSWNLAHYAIWVLKILDTCIKWHCFSKSGVDHDKAILEIRMWPGDDFIYICYCNCNSLSKMVVYMIENNQSKCRPSFSVCWIWSSHQFGLVDSNMVDLIKAFFTNLMVDLSWF